MSTFISQQKWDSYSNIINDFYKDIGKQEICWRRNDVGFSRYQEGVGEYWDIRLEGLIEYPFQRKWAIDKILPEGQLDQMYSGLYLNKKYLEELGYINAEGYFEFSPALDRFYFNGFWYKCYGNMQAAQTSDNPLYFIIILERDEQTTGNTTAPFSR